MRHYNRDETLRRAWIDQLTATETQREKKKQRLIEILKTQQDYQQFEKERKKLVKSTYSQGLFWAAPSEGSILWKILKLFGINKREGSRLRKILSEPPKINEIIAIPDEASSVLPDQPNASLDTDTAFEEAMYSNPTQALAWIQQRILQLTTNSGSVPDDTTNKVLERLSAFRARLPEIEYFKLLKQIVSVKPKPVLIHLHKEISAKALHDTNYDFMEVHCFSELLLKQVLFSINSTQLVDPIYTKYDIASKLLIILENNLNNFMSYLANQSNQQSIRESIEDFMSQNSVLNKNYQSLAMHDQYPQSKESYMFLTESAITKHIYKLLLDYILFDFTSDTRRVSIENMSTLTDPRNQPALNIAWTNFGKLGTLIQCHGKGSQVFLWIEKKVIGELDTLTSRSIAEVRHAITSQYNLATPLSYAEGYCISPLIQEIEKSLPGEAQGKLADTYIKEKLKNLSPLQVDWTILRMQEHYQRHTGDQAYTAALIDSIKNAFKEVSTSVNPNPAVDNDGETHFGDQKEPTYEDDHLPTSKF